MYSNSTIMISKSSLYMYSTIISAKFSPHGYLSLKVEFDIFILIKIHGINDIGLRAYINTNEQNGHIVDTNHVITFHFYHDL